MRQHKVYKENVRRPWSVVRCRRFLLALALQQTIDNRHTGRGEAEIRYPVAAFFLDSGQSLRAFRNDGIGALTHNIELLTTN